MENKKIEEMTERELMLELLKEQKKNNFHEMVSAAANFTVLLVVIVLSFVMAPKAIKTMDNMNSLINDTNQVVIEASASLENIDKMVEGVNQLVEENDEAVDQIIKNVSEVDLDGLNRSIKNLESVIEPLANFFKVFNR